MSSSSLKAVLASSQRTATLRTIPVPEIPAEDQPYYLAFHKNEWPDRESIVAALKPLQRIKAIFFQDDLGRVVVPIGKHLFSTKNKLALGRNKIRRGVFAVKIDQNGRVLFDLVEEHAPPTKFGAAVFRSDRALGVQFSSDLELAASVLFTGQGSAGKTALIWTIYTLLLLAGEKPMFVRSGEPEAESEALEVPELLGATNWASLTGRRYVILETVKAEFYEVSLPPSSSPSESGPGKGGVPSLTLQGFLSDFFAATEWLELNAILSGLPASDSDIEEYYLNALKMHTPELVNISSEPASSAEFSFTHSLKLLRSRFRPVGGPDGKVLCRVSYTLDALYRTRPLRALAMMFETRTPAATSAKPKKPGPAAPADAPSATNTVIQPAL